MCTDGTERTFTPEDWERRSIYVETARYPQEITCPVCGYSFNVLIKNEKVVATTCENPDLCKTEIEYQFDRRSGEEKEDGTEQTQLITDGGQVEEGTDRKDVPYQTGTVEAEDGNEYPRRKQKGVFNGICDVCGEPIYRAYDHAKGCIYG